MPLKWFICPDGQTTEVKDCLAKCRMGQRCLTKSTLLELGKERPPMENPSVTQLLNGPRLEYLKGITDFSEAPDDMAFRFLGTKSHHALELSEHEDGLNETRLYNHLTTGQFDNLEFEAGEWSLTDYKTYGSYRVKRMLEEGNQEVELQLNMLRLLIEKADPKIQVGGNTVDKISHLYVQVIVRDGGLWIAKKAGIPWKMRRLTVAILPDHVVEGYFKMKQAELKLAQASKQMPRLCDSAESWEGARCKGYCPVADQCNATGDNHWLRENDTAENMTTKTKAKG